MTEILIEGRRVKVGDDFKSLSPEQQAETVDEIANQMGIKPGAVEESEGDNNNFFGQANRKIAQGIDAINPFNAIRGGINSVTGSDLPTDVSAETSLPELGIPVANRAPDGIIENAGAGTGAAATALLPAAGFLKMMAGAKALGGFSGMIGQLSDDALNSIATTPGVLTELFAGASAGAGGEVAADSFGEDARGLGEVIGGLGLPVGGMAAVKGTKLAQKLPVVGAVANTAQRTLLPMAGPGARVAASGRVRGVAGDADAAARNIEAENIGNLTPAQQSGDPGLASLENRLAVENPEFGRELREGTERSAAILRDELARLGGGGDVNDAVDFISGRREQFNKRLSGLVESAEKRAESRVAKLAPERQQSANSVIVREEIDKAYGQAKNQERNLWSRVPQDVMVPTTSARARFEALSADTPTALADDIPDEARRMFASNQGVGEESTVREMLGLVSKMRQISRAARSGEVANPNRARIADDIADGVLDDLENLPANSQRVAKAVAEARAYSRELSETFKQGAVNTVRSRRSTGRGSVPAEAALGATVGTGGPRGAVAARDIRSATGGATDATGAQGVDLTGFEMPRGGVFVVDRSTSKAVFETTNASDLEDLDIERFAVVPSQDALVNFNRRVKAAGGVQPPDSPLAEGVEIPMTRGGAALPGGNPRTDDAIEDFLRGQATDKTVRGDEFSDRSAEAFQRQNRDTLDEFPAVRDDLQGARDATADVQSTRERVKRISDRLNDKRQSVDAAFLQASPGREVAEAVFAARNPTAAARKIRNATVRDDSGRALDGVKSGFLDNLIKSASGPGLDANNASVISGSRLKARLSDPKARGALAQVFEPQELSRMDRLATQLSKIENAAKAGRADALIDDLPNKFLSVFAQVQAARVGSAVARRGGGGNIQTPGIFVNRVKGLLGRLTNDRAEALLVDAIKDPELMSALLRNLDDPRAGRAAAKRLNSWLIGTGAIATTEEQ